MLTEVPGDGAGHEGAKDGSPSLIDEIVREGARRMLVEALQAEVGACIAAFAAERDENGRRLVVRNGFHEPREVLTRAGAVEVTAPRVNDKRAGPQTGERKRFCSGPRPRPRSRAAGLAMAFKLIESAQGRWRVASAPQLVALVRAGAAFVNGKLAERPEDPQLAEAAAATDAA